LKYVKIPYLGKISEKVAKLIALYLEAFFISMFSLWEVDFSFFSNKFKFFLKNVASSCLLSVQALTIKLKALLLLTIFVEEPIIYIISLPTI